jgi:UDP:flavonoid glycosyltransferase YjiC (YdhE family)
VPGEESPFAQQHVFRTAPFLIRDADELPARMQAERLLGSGTDEPAILVVGAGTPQECQETHRLMQAMQCWRIATEYALRLAVPDSDLRIQPSDEVPLVRHVPLMECLPAVRLVIGAGGYNLLHETAALQVPAIFWPRPRKYDDQFRRVATRLSATSLEALDQVVHWELRRPFVYTGVPAYHNGAAAAARLITAVLEQRGAIPC